MRLTELYKILLILSLCSHSIQKEEEIKEGSETIIVPEIPSINNNTNKTSKVPVILPEAKIILPIRRIGTSASQLNQGPCGGVERLKADTLTNKGSNLHFIWETVIPAKSSNCTVSISKGLEKEEDFSLLYPTDGSADKNGVFPCGRSKGFESQEFALPQDYECDQCILQWKWTTSYGDIYSCSDIIINGGNMTACMAKCQNGGACFNGQCMCLDGFSGEFCEKTQGKGVNWLLILLILIALALIGAITYYFINKKFFKSWTTSNKSEIKQPFTENKNRDYNIDDSQRQEH